MTTSRRLPRDHASTVTTVDLGAYVGEVVLVVNTASKCGLTPQYDGLQKLYDDYADQGLVVLGFPCDQFGHQEPGTEEEIAAFCEQQLRRHVPDVRQDRRQRRRHPPAATGGSSTRSPGCSAATSSGTSPSS